ncbi:hypothetical protein, partial [Vibrio sp. M260118]
VKELNERAEFNNLKRHSLLHKIIKKISLVLKILLGIIGLIALVSFFYDRKESALETTFRALNQLQPNSSTATGQELAFNLLVTNDCLGLENNTSYNHSNTLYFTKWPSFIDQPFYRIARYLFCVRDAVNLRGVYFGGNPTKTKL